MSRAIATVDNMSYGMPSKAMPPGMRQMPVQNYGDHYSGASVVSMECQLGVQKVENPDLRNDYIFSNMCDPPPHSVLPA